MVTAQEIKAQEMAFVKLEADEDYQMLIGDIRSCVNNIKVTQTNRIRSANRLQQKADGTATKNASAVAKIIKTSESFRKFATDLLKKILGVEDEFEKYLKKIIKKHPVYSDWLSNVTGVGPALAGTILSEFRPERIYYVGQMFSYSGIIGDTSRKKGVKANYNTFLKSRLLGVLGDSFLKGESEYAIYYYQYMCRKLNMFLNGDEEYRKANPLARMNRQAVRWMVQRFVKDYYVAWRTIMGFPNIKSYEEEKLGMVHCGNEWTSFETYYKVDKATMKKNRRVTLAKLDEFHQKVDELKIACGFAKNLAELRETNPFIKKHPELGAETWTYAEMRKWKEDHGEGRGRKGKKSDEYDE